MSRLKLLLYCTKGKPYLTRNDLPGEKGEFYKHYQLGGELDKKHLYGYTPILNGKIVAECDFEVEEIGQHRQFLGFGYDLFFETETLEDLELQKKSCLDTQQLANYFNSNADCGEKVGYAIHINNLNIFDKPKELNSCFTKKPYKDINKLFTDEVMIDSEWYRPVDKAPQNMMRVWLYENGEWVMYILISIQPQWMCLILNRIKDVEVRKKVLKEMIGNA